MKKNKKILIASSNNGKIKEFEKLLSDFQIYSLSDFNIRDAIEDGESFLENAIIKAEHGYKYSHHFTIADDSGLVVPELNNEPGIYSARYAGDNASDEQNRKKLIRKLKLNNYEKLDAFYVCYIVGIKSINSDPIVSSGKIYGEVKINESGSGGFGYDKMFYPRDFECSMAEIDLKTKNLISHRAIAIKNFLSKCKKVIF